MYIIVFICEGLNNQTYICIYTFVFVHMDMCITVCMYVCMSAHPKTENGSKKKHTAKLISKEQSRTNFKL